MAPRFKWRFSRKYLLDPVVVFQLVVVAWNYCYFLKVKLQWKSTSFYTSCAYSIYHHELALGTFIRHFVSTCLVCHTSWENSSKVVFENSRFQIAEAFQSLLRDSRSDVVVNKSRTCWAKIVISSSGGSFWDCSPGCACLFDFSQGVG